MIESWPRWIQIDHGGVVTPQIVVDGREFVPGTMTGIGRFLFGVLKALCRRHPGIRLKLAIGPPSEASSALSALPQVQAVEIPARWIDAERVLSDLANREGDLFLSPYPKLPILPMRCPALNTVHDVHDITHYAYRYRPKALLDRVRLQISLIKARLTWFDSAYSLAQTRRIASVPRKRARVRHLAVDEKFDQRSRAGDIEVLSRHGIAPGYILVLGNGMPHKNLGVLLTLTRDLSRTLVVVGVPKQRRLTWQKQYPIADAIWIERASDTDLPALLRAAFCLALPSTAEGYGYPPLEAMACGTPAVVSDIDVLVETSGGNALFAPPYDKNEWRANFFRLEDPDFRAAMVEKGLEWATAHKGGHGWKRHVTDIIKLLDRV